MNFQIPKSIKSVMMVSEPHDLDTEILKIKKIKQLYHIRHDILHFMVNEILYLPQVFDKHITMSEWVDCDMPECIKNLSPDCVINNNETLTIIDISCSQNFESNFQEKKEKYDIILSSMRNIGYKCNEFYMFWVKPDLSNINSAFQELYLFLDKHLIKYRILTESNIDYCVNLFDNISVNIQKMKISLPVNIFGVLQKTNQPKPVILEDKILMDASLKSYPQLKDIKDHISSYNMEDIEKTFKSLVEDGDIRSYIKDQKHENSMYDRAFDILKNAESYSKIGHIKPSFFIPYADCSKELLSHISECSIRNSDSYNESSFKSEQLSILKFLSVVGNINEFRKTDTFGFINNLTNLLYQTFEYSTELKIFNTGLLTGSQDLEEELNQKYHEFNKDNKGTCSKRTFYKKSLGDLEVRDELPYIYRNKCIKIPSQIGRSKTFLQGSGTSYKKEHEVREYKEKKTIGLDSYKIFENFLELLDKKPTIKYDSHPFIGGGSGCDSDSAYEIKEALFKEQREFMSQITNTNAHSFSRHTSLCASQLLHFNELKTTDNSFYMFTSGQGNILHIVRGGTHNRKNDIGQAYFTLFLTDNKEWCSKVYGKVEIYPFFCSFKKKEYYLCITPWVRLTSERLSFMKDQYYSVLATSFASWERNKAIRKYEGALRFFYTFRMCVSSAPSQKIAELLMDTRYIFMSALSDYSNVEKLIIDKFAPPYKNCFEQYIVRQLHKKAKEVAAYLLIEAPKPNKPAYSGTKRLHKTLGGKIGIPSLWSNIILNDIQSIFDDIFVYVHTSKEPSSEYHEQIKAMNTIIKFQCEFDRLNYNMKHGISSDLEIKKWILSGSQVGCCTKVIYHATRTLSKQYNGIHKSPAFKDACLQEPLCSIVSTKACIPEINRIETNEELKKNKMKQVINNISSLVKSEKFQYILNNKPIRKNVVRLDMNILEEQEIVVTGSNRSKVHDALLDWMTRNKENNNYVIDLASWNIKANNCKVLTDTCIKAQYGAKREFYVLNLGSKAMARLTENSFKELSKCCKNEMISVPGDKKLNNIQDMVNNAIRSSERKNDILMYVNGDCTKWSACETMASFISFNLGLEDVLGKKIMNYNNVTFCSWADKQIQIPQQILENLRFISSTTMYADGQSHIRSTQNFLQGMFNYASSMKSVIATEFAIYMFKKINPNTFIHCGHLEHSDDYSLIVRTNRIEDFEEFRLYHKLSQKLFGINDSIKKTNIQRHIQEFISLFSFNGELYYPHIKKVKEVGMNVGCTDFRSDAMTIISRVSESIRIGIPLNTSYFMQRIHCASLADAYSITPKMRNSLGTVSNIFSRPLELFGLPDTLPILYVSVKGCPDNYRLYHYGNSQTKIDILKLFYLSNKLETSINFTFGEDVEVLNEFYKPKFSYPLRKQRLKKIREKLKMTFDEAVQYFDDNKTDCLTKPIETERFIKWLRAMYFNNSFTNAYMRVSRSAMTLRHSFFTSKPCIVSLKNYVDQLSQTNIDNGKGNKLDNKNIDIKFVSIKKFIEDFREVSVPMESLNEYDNKDLKEFINCYNNCIQMFYGLLNKSGKLFVQLENTHTTVCSMPNPYKWINLENKTSTILQYHVDPKNFFEDRRNFISETSLARDIQKLSKHFDMDYAKKSSQYCRKIFKEISSQSENKAFGLMYEDNITDFLSYVKHYFSNAFSTERSLVLLPNQITKYSHVKTGKQFYSKDWRLNVDTITAYMSELALIYRCIILNKDDSLSSNLEYLLEINLPEYSMSLKDYFGKTTLQDLIDLKVGETTLKIFCFLKMKLTNISTDLREFMKSKLFYKIQYLTKSECKFYGSTESITGVFMNSNFKGHMMPREEIQPLSSNDDIRNIGKNKLKKENILILETASKNRSVWYYQYSIAERAFGLISQIEFEARLSESKDFRIPIYNPEQLNCMERLKKKDAMFFLVRNDILSKTSNCKIANLPIIIQFQSYKLMTKVKHAIINNVDIKVTDISVSSGNINLYKLPFGILTDFSLLDTTDITFENIKLKGIPLKLLKENGLISDYLKNNYTNTMNTENINKNIDIIFTQYIIENKDSNKQKKWLSCDTICESFDPNIITINTISKDDMRHIIKNYPKVNTANDELNKSNMQLVFNKLEHSNDETLQLNLVDKIREQQERDYSTSIFSNINTIANDDEFDEQTTINEMWGEQLDFPIATAQDDTILNTNSTVNIAIDDFQREEISESSAQIDKDVQKMNEIDESSLASCYKFDFGDIAPCGTTNDVTDKVSAMKLDDEKMIGNDKDQLNIADLKVKELSEEELSTAYNFDFDSIGCTTEDTTQQKCDLTEEELTGAYTFDFSTFGTVGETVEPVIENQECDITGQTKNEIDEETLTSSYNFNFDSFSAVEPAKTNSSLLIEEDTVGVGKSFDLSKNDIAGGKAASSDDSPMQRVTILGKELPQDYMETAYGNLIFDSIDPVDNLNEETKECDFQKIFEDVSTVGQQIDIEKANIINQAFQERNDFMKYWSNDIIESRRDCIILDNNIEAFQLNELLEEDDVFEDVNEDSSSSSGSSEEEHIHTTSWTQSIPQRMDSTQAYEFEKRAREGLLTPCNFFIRLWFYEEANCILESKKDLSSLLVVTNYVKEVKKNITLKRKENKVIVMLWKCLKDICDLGFRKVAITNNKCIELTNNGINFYMSRGFMDKDDAVRKSSQHPGLNYERSILNMDDDFFYVTQKMKTHDLEYFLKDNQKDINIQGSITSFFLSSICKLINSTIDIVEEDYDLFN